MRNALRHVDLENCRSMRGAHTARIDGGGATSRPLPDIPHIHPHLVLKQYQFPDDFSSSHCPQSIARHCLLFLETPQGGGVYPPPRDSAENKPSCRVRRKPLRLFLIVPSDINYGGAHMTFKPNVHASEASDPAGFSAPHGDNLKLFAIRGSSNLGTACVHLFIR
jgi:hypothetical protein